MASIVGGAVSKVAEYTFGVIKRGIVYIVYVDSNVQNLKEQVARLEDARGRVQHSVETEERNAEEIEADVRQWLTKVDKILTENDGKKLKVDEEKAQKKCFIGLCPNFKSRYQLSKKAETQANAIAQLLEEEERFKGVSYRPVLAGISARPVREYEAFESRSGALNWIMAALEDDNFNITGVYGMGGVGKTTLVKEAARQAKYKKLFDEVVFVAITQTPNTVNIQNEIAEKLGLKFDEKSMDVRAAWLHERLKKDKKVLIILDDIWEILNLDDIGIPSRDEHKGCKILMTSRNLEVLKSMNSQKNLAIKILGEDEAWNLFKKVAGQIVEKSDVKPTAIEVAKKCAGLPVAIATVATALKHKENAFEWKNALRELRRPSERNFKGISADAYSVIELSYKFLEVEEHRPVFLLCSIMGHNAAIEDLLRYGSGLGLFHGVNSTEETRDKVLTLVSNLKASCLLLDGSNPGQFDVHDIVRDVAISIASRDHHWLALGRDDVFKEWSDEETMKNYNLISLQDAKVSELLGHEFHLECPNLTFFSMGGKDYSSLKIPNNFFKGMKRLKVLVFSEMHFSSLPSSIGSLKTLRTLYLLDCDLKDIVILGELENLQILSLRRSRIAMLPKEIGQLSRLKLLDLTRCYNLEVISPNILSSLSRLEELYLYNSFDRWEVQGHGNRSKNASLAELQLLSHLTTLEVHIPNEQAMPKDGLFFANMKRYKIFIGRKWDYLWDNLMETSRIMKIKVNKSIHLFDGVKTLMRKIESLYIDEVKDVMDMLFDPLTEGLSHLKHLCICNVSDIKFVFDSKKLVSSNAFPLKFLSLENLNNLEAICDGQLKAESFGQLKVIKVGNCDMLKNLLPFSIARELRQLEEIEVHGCKNMTKLFIVENREEETVGNEVIDILEFSQLRSLNLINLLSFTGLCCSGKKLSSSQQRRVQPNAMCLFDGKVALPVLERLLIVNLESLGRLWHNQLAEDSFAKLISIYLGRCDKLLNVFPWCMLTRLQKLKELSIQRCELLEEIFESQQCIPSNLEIIKFEFSCLTSLTLNGLPKLKSFYQKIHTTNWPSLKKLCVSGCNKVEILFASQETNEKSQHETLVQQPLFWVNKCTFPSLHQLTLGWNAGMKEIWHCHGQQQLLSDYFGNLKIVQLRWCPKQVTRLPSYLFQLLSLPNLETLGIHSSDFKEIFQIEEGVGGEEKPAWVVLSQITELRLEYLDELMHLWKEKEGFQNLKILHMQVCSKLGINLVPSTVSFQNLVSLEVWRCDGIIKLVTHSTAKSLVQLKEMSIYSCQILEEIIEGGDDAQYEIDFPQLNRLSLRFLPKLESFCSLGSYTFRFSSLETVIVQNCPKLKMFSRGQSNAPMLHKIRLHDWENEERWEGNLNSTIQRLFKEKNAVAEGEIFEKR